MEAGNFIIENYRLILWLILCLMILIALIPFFRKIRNADLLKTVTSLNRGTPSERDLVLKLLKHGIPAQTIFHDLCIEKYNGDFSQIDLVLATTEGIIVIEVKDYSGWLYGNGNYTQWTKVLAYGKRKYRFYNPIKQNLSHIKALRKQLKQFQNIPFFSIIVFYGDCELKEIDYVPKGTFLVKENRIFEVLKQVKKTNEAAPYTNKKEVVKVLQEGVKIGANITIQEQHIDNIDEMVGKHRIFD